MKQAYSRALIVITIFAVLIVAFFLLRQWLTPFQSLRAIVALPSLFIFPGLFIVQTFFTKLDLSEKIILALFLSFVIIHLGIFAIEEITTGLTYQKTALVVGLINTGCLVIFLTRRFLTRIFSHLPPFPKIQSQ